MSGGRIIARYFRSAILKVTFFESAAKREYQNLSQ